MAPDVAGADLGSGDVAAATSAEVLLLIDIQVSYINTNHEDFIGFAKYVSETRDCHVIFLLVCPHHPL
ncbi:Hypothetical predicted protein [Marmota monax]|uniref:Uncharacterized protein n=1 Tax=Marmota monax TaxID=9995 RepID=A0A5E4AJ83_MARMO|nr:hypothetical protein GHT09_007690 [Marmota monax]VTJ57040.1 Hypothetical predicted protein [Marmota monax]